jgi:Mrp family chromosome partitioning ATPase/capsular polysaccharide biosynthesis protein
MTTTARHDAPRYATLRDYLRVVRRNRLVIALIAVAFAGAAYALTSREKATFQARASLFFKDVAQEVNLLGTTVFPSLPDVTRAQIAAQSLKRAQVTQRVKKQLNSPLSLTPLAAPVSTFVDQQTNVVVIQASSADGAYAQRLANAYAQAAKIQGRVDAQAQFKTVIAGIKAQNASLSPTLQGDAYTRSVYSQRIVTLTVLEQTVDPVQIVSAAGFPSAPSGPRTVRNSILGFLLGLTIGIILAFLRDALDRRLRGSADIGEQLGWPIIGHVRESAFGVPAFVSGNGKAPDEGDRESFRILRQNLRFLDVDNAPRSVVITSALPEEGKSTVAAALASASAAAGTPTLLVECDLRRPSLAERLGLKRAPGLTDFLLGEATPAEIVQVLELPPPPPIGSSSSNGHAPVSGVVPASTVSTTGEPRRLACITAGRPVPETAELLGSARFKGFLEEVTKAYELVVLDASPLLSVADTSQLLPEAEATLICVRAGRTTYDEAAAAKQAVERIPHRLIGVVVTGVTPGGEHDLGYYSYAYTYQPS